VTRTKSAGRITNEQVMDLWEQYKRSGDPRLRDRLVLTLAPLVKYIVYKKVKEIPARCEVDDFISCGLEALIRSIDRFDPSRGASLEQFAWTRIHGAVLDELRRLDWAPRSLRRLEREVRQADGRFTTLYGRRPTRVELADAVGISVRDLSEHIDDVTRADVGSLNQMVLGDEECEIERIETLISVDEETNPELAAMRSDAVKRFRAAFDRLGARDRQVAVLLYVDQLTLREIGEVIGVTESRVSQIHAELRRKLRLALAADSELLAAAA
jgi:RNA polymerase sigma factor for flagellar operon FliA